MADAKESREVRARGAKRSHAMLHIIAMLAVQAAAPSVASETSNGVPYQAAVARAASPLLAIDRNRATIADRIVTQWGDALSVSDAGLNAEQLRTMLLGLRSDHLLAASLAGNLEGLRNVIAQTLISTAEVKTTLVQPKSLGDAADDLVYTPVIPCPHHRHPQRRRPFRRRWRDAQLPRVHRRHLHLAGRFGEQLRDPGQPRRGDAQCHRARRRRLSYHVAV